MSLSGRTFTINENPSITYALCRIAVNFTDGTSSYSCFECDTVAIYYHPDLSGTAGPPIVVYENSEWQNASYRTITFTSEATEFVLGDDISNQAQFEAWLAENATEEGVEPEPVSNPVSVSKLLLGPKVMGGSSSSAAGAPGLAPAPAAGDHTKFLRGDGTWNDAPKELPAVTSSDNGKALVVIEGNWGAGNIDWSNITGKPNRAGSPSDGGDANSARAVKTYGDNVVMGTAGSESNDSGDIVWLYGSEAEKSRIYTLNSYSAKSGPNYRVYNSAGSLLYDGVLPLGDGTGASGSWGIDVTGSAGSLSGFSKANSQVWGNQTGTLLHSENESNGGAWAIRTNNPTAGQASFILDGTVYIKEGAQNVAAAIKTFNTGVQVHTATDLWGNTFTIPVSRPLIYLGGSGTRWMKMGTFVAGQGESIYIIWQTGSGYNGGVYQNSIFEIYMKCWNHATQSVSHNAFGVTIYARNRNGAVFKPVVTAYNTVELWVYLPGWYSTGVFTYQKCGGTWTTSGATQSTEPSGTSANMEYRDLVDSVNISSYRTFAYSSGPVAGNGTQATIPYPSGYTVANTMPIGCFLFTSGTRHDVTPVEVEYLDSSGIHVVNYGASSGQIAVALMKYEVPAGDA